MTLPVFKTGDWRLAVSMVRSTRTRFRQYFLWFTERSYPPLQLCSRVADKWLYGMLGREKPLNGQIRPPQEQRAYSSRRLRLPK